MYNIWSIKELCKRWIKKWTSVFLRPWRTRPSDLTYPILSLNCKSSLRSIGIDTKIISINGKLTEITDFRIDECTKIRAYQIESILELIDRKIPLTENQMEIYQIFIQDTNNREEVMKRSRLLDVS